MDNAFCGGGDTSAGITDPSIPISSAAQAQIKAAIFLGDPRYRYGQAYGVGTCRASGVRFLLSMVIGRPNQRIVCRPSSRFHLPQRRQSSTLLRLARSLLLQRQRRKPPPAVCLHLRLPGDDLYPRQAQRFWWWWHAAPCSDKHLWWWRWWWYLLFSLGPVRWQRMEWSDLLFERTLQQGERLVLSMCELRVVLIEKAIIDGGSYSMRQLGRTYIWSPQSEWFDVSSRATQCRIKAALGHDTTRRIGQHKTAVPGWFDHYFSVLGTLTRCWNPETMTAAHVARRPEVGS